MNEQEMIQNRYAAESISSCDLSCGSNIDLLQIREGESILDLGSGRGAEAIEAARRCGPAGNVRGLDLTPEMVAAAKSNAAREGVSNIGFDCGSIEELPYEEGRFDAVISNCVINHAEDKEKVFREIARVLKKGGRFVISDAVSARPLPKEIRDSAEARAQCFGGAVTEGEYLQSILSAGFSRTEILGRREYLKNGYDFASITLKAYK